MQKELARTQDVEKLYEQGQRLEYALLPGLMKRIRRDKKSDQDALWDLRKGKTTGGRQTDSSHRGC